MNSQEKIVLVTGVTGGIGSRVAAALEDDYCIIGMDLDCEEDERNFSVDLRSVESVRTALNTIRERFGSRLASVVHLAAYFDFSGENNPLYQEVNVDGTRRLLDGLQNFEVEQFLYASTMLVHAPTTPGVPINEDSPLDPAWQYPQSKLATEETIERHHGTIPYTALRIAGVYDDDCNVPTLAHQIQRIYERRIKGHLFAGDLDAGQSFVHRDDAVDAISRAVRCRAKLKETRALLIGEPEVMSYKELQDELARLVHDENWLTRSIPKTLAKVGAWLQLKGEKIVPDAIDQGRKPFIKPFMISLSDDHYELDIARARDRLGWSPPPYVTRETAGHGRGVEAGSGGMVSPQQAGASGAVTYMLEILTGLVGSRRRWRTMPWMVLLFGILIVPLGAVSIFFIIIQPIVIGTWCTLCLVAAAAMVIQIPYSLDELIATCQFLAQRRRKGQPLWQVLLHGDTAAGGRAEPPSDFEQPVRSINREMWGGGLNLPWTLLASIAIGIWLMFTRLTLGTEGALADSDHLIGALVITVSVVALAEIARAARYLNVLFGLALIVLPWMLDGGSLLAQLAGMAAGLALVALSLPRGKIDHSYGSWDRFIS